MLRSKKEVIKDLYVELVKYISENLDTKYDKCEKNEVLKCASVQFYKHVFNIVDDFVNNHMLNRMKTVRAARLCDLEDYLYDYSSSETDTGEEPDCDLTPFEQELFAYFSYDYYEKRNEDCFQEMQKLLSAYANKVNKKYPQNIYAKGIAIALNPELIKPSNYKQEYKNLVLKLKLENNKQENQTENEK